MLNESKSTMTICREDCLSTSITSVRQGYRRLGLLCVACLLTIYVIHSLINRSNESTLLNILSTVAVTKPDSCDPETNFNFSGATSMHQTAVQPEDGFLVPNVVHYIWYSDKAVSFKFFHMLSVISAEKFIKPKVIYFHTNFEPVGGYWERTKREVKSLKIMNRKPSTCLFGQKIKEPVYGTSQSNVDRLVVLMEHGGIYLDLDAIVVRSLDPLRKYPCTVGLENPNRVCGGIIVCSASSPFLNLWIEHFIFDYRIWQWAYNTGLVPTGLAIRYPDLVHVEESKLAQPDGGQIQKIWAESDFDWTQNYVLHLYWRVWKAKHLYLEREPDDLSILTDNSAFGQLARKVLDID